ncbi:MAG: hypothetical protein GYA14_03260 [Ignavibacteria bacterium]|nr:hypothetical protein [Ignavibacteria bacterium]
MILVKNFVVFIPALVGFTLGIVIDYLFVSKFIKNAYKLRLIWPASIVIFYSFCMFGFFMGVPVFNFLLGIPIGFYSARREVLLEIGQDQAKNELTKASLFGSILMFITCLISASIALNDPYTASGIKGMLSLPFTINQTWLTILVIIGGIILTIGEYFLITITSKITKKRVF